MIEPERPPTIELCAPGPLGWQFHAPVVHRGGIEGMPGPMHVHGVGVVDGVLVHARHPPSPRPASAALGMAIRGVMTLYVGRDAILPDPLGASMTFIWQRGRDWAISSDLNALAWWLNKQGVRPRKSSLYAMVLLATGAGSFDLASYDGIRALAAGEYVAIDRDHFQTRRYPVDEYLATPIAFADALDEAEAEIAMNVRAASRAGFANLTVHLTGGFDSRLVTAACLRERLDFVSFCSGPREAPDKRVAEAICAQLGLPMTHRGGWVETAVAPSLEARLRDEMNAVAGMTQQVRTGTAARGLPSTLVLSGGLGERFRGRYRVLGNEPMSDVARDMWGGEVFPAAGEVGILTPDARALLEAMLTEALESSAATWEDRLDAFRTRHRNQYTFGLTTRRFSEIVPRFDPLYSLAGIRAAFSGGAEVRRSRKVAFELMQRFDARFTRLPFGDGAWPPELGAPAPVAFRGGRPRYVDEPEQPLPLWRGAGVLSAGDREIVGRVRATAWQVAHRVETQALCRELIPANREVVCWLNPRMIDRLVNHEPKHRKHYRMLYQLATTLVWFGDRQRAASGSRSPSTVE